MRRPAVISAAIALSASAAGAAGWFYHDVFPPGRALPGTYVGGRLQPADARLGAWLEGRRQALAAREVFLTLPDGSNLRSSYGALGIDLDVAATMKTVHAHAAGTGLASRIHRARMARRGEVDLPLTFSVDEERARAALQDIAPRVWKAPVDARLDLVGHQRIDDQPGAELDVDGTLVMIRDSERDDPAVIPIWTRAVNAQVTSEALAAVDVSKVLGAFETDFTTKSRSRDPNIRKGAEYLNGFVMAPGQVLSFNEVVGARRVDRGFVWAPVIVDDELTPGVGGGICQVASTLHAAAVHGALEVVQRRSHSRPSGYAPLGLDATVIYGEVDLKIKNPYDSPLIVHAFFPHKTKLRVELLGRDPPGKIEHRYAVVRTHDYYRRVWTKDHLETGRRLKRQRGIKGYDVISVISIQQPSGQSEERRYWSWYRPVPEVYWVGPGTSLAELPELPDGAGHMEVDGEKQQGPATAELDSPEWVEPGAIVDG